MTYFFVGGAARSGTTLLNSILCHDPTTNPFIAEANYLANILSVYRSGRNLWDFEGESYFDDFEDYSQFSRRWVLEFLEKTRKRYTPAQHLVLKAPELTKYFPELCAWVDDAKFLILLRDPRDAIASLIEVGKTLKKTGINPALVKMLESSDAAQLGEFYNAYYQPCHHCNLEGFWSRVRYVQYEGLVRYPDAALQQLEAFTGLSLHQFDRQGTWQRSHLNFQDLPADYQPWWSTPLYGKGISAASIGRYRQILTPSQIRDIERTCATLFALGNYSPDFPRERSAPQLE